MEDWKLIGYQFVCLTLYLLAFLDISEAVSNLKPLHFFDLRQSLKPFYGQNNDTFPDHFKFLYHDNGQAYIGGRNRLYNLSVDPDGNIVEHEHLEWEVSEKQRKACHGKYYSHGDCNNYLSLMGKLSPQKVILCGTHAFDPKCRVYRSSDKTQKSVGGTLGLAQQEYQEKSGMGYTHFHQYQNSTATIVNGHVFAGTFVDVWSSEPIVYREPVRTLHAFPPALNGPQFVLSFEYGRYVYFLLREWAMPPPDVVTTDVAYHVVRSRVARVCADDPGYRDPVYDRPLLWRTYLKVEIACHVPNAATGAAPYDTRDRGDRTALAFDSLVGASPPAEGGEGRFYALFTLNSPPGTAPTSAVCQFEARDLEKAFANGIRRPNSSPETKDESSSHIGDCDYPYSNPDDAYYVQNNPLLPGLTVSGIPLAVWSNKVPTTIAVDYGVAPFSYQNLGAAKTQVTEPLHKDVLFLGTYLGKIFKIVITSPDDVKAGKGPKVDVIEGLDLYANRQTAITGLHIYRRYASTDSAHLMVTWPGRLLALPLARCQEFDSCTSCRVDPYCAWDGRRCTLNTSTHHRYDATNDHNPSACPDDAGSYANRRGFHDSDLEQGQAAADQAPTFFGENDVSPLSNRIIVDPGQAAQVDGRDSIALRMGQDRRANGPVVAPNYYGGQLSGNGPTRCSADRLSLAIVATAFVTSLISCFVGFRLKSWLDRKQCGSDPTGAMLNSSGLGNGPSLLHHHPAYFVMNKVGGVGAPHVAQAAMHQSIYEPLPLPPLLPHRFGHAIGVLVKESSADLQNNHEPGATAADGRKVYI